MKKTVTVVGHAAYDYLFNVAEHPRENHSAYILDWEKHYGGGAANIATGIAALGGKSRLYTVAGSDFKRYESYLARNGVKCVLTRSNRKTPRAYIFNASGRQKMYFYWGASEEMAHMRGIASEYCHIAPCHPSLAVKMVEKSRFVAFEPGQDMQKYDDATLSYITEEADIIFCNETELRVMEKRASLGEKEVIVTLGELGSMLCKRNMHIPAVPVKSVDPTGAGDAYKAGFWAAFLKGYEIPECCRIGAAVASFIVERTGTQHFPAWDDVMSRYAHHGSGVQDL